MTKIMKNAVVLKGEGRETTTMMETVVGNTQAATAVRQDPGQGLNQNLDLVQDQGPDPAQGRVLIPERKGDRTQRLNSMWEESIQILEKKT